MLIDLSRLPFSYSYGNNPCCESSSYECKHCGLDLSGEDIGFVAAGWTCGGDQEWARCPQCGRENSVDRNVECEA